MFVKMDRDLANVPIDALLYEAGSEESIQI
jgi:hypothetical protein